MSTYEFAFNSFAFDPYGRYLAILDKQEKLIQLNILDCVGECLLVKNVPDVEQVLWRPEDREFMNVGIDMEEEVARAEGEILPHYD